MDTYRWLVEQEQDLLYLVEDWLRGRDMNDKQKPLKTWDVTIAIPGQEEEVLRIEAVDNMDAKAEASKQYYGSVFTGQFKYMRARIVTEDENK